jgi:Ras GTPase-activating-like protein IQGAP2/3
MINQIEEETGSLPSNLPRGVAPEIAAENPDVQAIIAPRLTMLMEIANSFLLTIIESMDSVPYGIRWICKQIRSLTRVRAAAFAVVCVPYLVNSYFSESIPKQPTMPFARSLVASSSFDLSIRPLSHHKHIC